MPKKNKINPADDLAQVLKNALLKSTEEQRGLLIIGALLGLIVMGLTFLVMTPITKVIIALVGFLIIAYILGFAFMRKYPDKINSNKYKIFCLKYHSLVKGIINESKK